MPESRKNYGALENFEPITYFGRKMWRSKKNPELIVLQAEQEGDVEGQLYGYAAKEKPTLVESLAGEVASLFGVGEEVPELEELREGEPTLPASLLSLDPSDPRALAQLVTDQSLATLSAQLAENPELLNQEGMFEQWMNLALIEQGFATDPVMAATATKALGMGYLEMFASGELDSPDKAEDAARAFAQQVQALTGLEEAALEEAGVSEGDELTALYEQQVREEAEFQQMGFYREGIMGLVSLAPPEARLGLMAGMLENPEIASLFFPREREPVQTDGGLLPPESKFVIE